jgi:hypothetical protein
MSPAALFAVGVLVTVFWGAGLSLLVYGAILDGRDEARRKAEEAARAGRPRVVRRPRPVPDNPSTEDDGYPAAA